MREESAGLVVGLVTVDLSLFGVKGNKITLICNEQ
jgi:hypothetical protein